MEDEGLIYIDQAVKMFLQTGENEDFNDPENSIFLSLTQREAVFMHMCSLIAVNSILESGRDPRSSSDVGRHLAYLAVMTDKSLGVKVMNAIRVQMLDADPIDPLEEEG